MDIRHKMLKLLLVVCLTSCARAAGGSSCLARDYGHGSVVCVCSSSHCDVPEPTSLQQLEAGAVRHYVTSKAGKRLEAMTMNFSASSLHDGAEAGEVTTVKVTQKQQYQTMLGFGGAATDAATINTYSLSAAAADKLISAYFSTDGIGYTFARVPVGPTDFSARYYEYVPQHDNTLKHFNLTAEDYDYKIPFLKRAEALSPHHVKMFATPWTAPQWMKKLGKLKHEFYHAFAKYNVRFLRAYKDEGLEFWGLTPQNEPTFGLNLKRNQTMGWTEDEMRQYLARNYGPLLNESGFVDLKMMIVDDNRNTIPDWLKILEDENLRPHVAGLAVHWYADKTTSAGVLYQAHQKYPDKFMLYTEACPERNSGDQRVILGNWADGAQYISDIIQVTNNWVSGWVDWNMVIDLDGGPNWVNETRDDAPVVVNATADEFYKQPTFYAIAHFSKFVPPGSLRVALQLSSDNLQGAAFLTPDNVTVVVLHNSGDSDVKAVISESARGSVTLNIPASSMHTVLYK